MKNLFIKSNLLVALIASLFIITSCETNDGESFESDLIGTWNIDDSSFEVTVDGVSLINFLMTTYQVTQQEAQAFINIFTADLGEDASGSITFKKDNTYNVVDGNYTESGTWSISSDGKTLTITGTEDNGTDTYTDDFTIVTLTSMKMVLTIAEESEMVDLDDDGIDETKLDIIMELVLSK